MAFTPPNQRRPGESSDERTEVESVSPFDPTAEISSSAAALPVAALSTAQSLPPPPSVELTAPSTPVATTMDADLAPGDVLGDYVIDSKIGRGGMGDVYLGTHQLIKKRAAIKLLRGESCRDATAVARFMAEARIVNEIGHPNIVDVFAFGETPDGRHFLVMEWLQGESLRARIARGPLDVEAICEVTAPLVRALMAAHAKGVVHRDLKPDNVFLQQVPGAPLTVKLLDFGIAKLSRPDPAMQQTASGVLVGTPMYIAPEQARGQGVDHRADIYTLGGMMFEMVTGRAPFVAATTFEIVAKHLMEPPVRASTLATVPRELDDTIFAMLSKEPADRPSLANVLALVEAQADHAKRPTTDYLLERESLGSIAVTSQRPASAPIVSVTTAPIRKQLPPLWLVPIVLLVGAAAAYVAVGRSHRDVAPARPTPAAPAPPMTAPASNPPPMKTAPVIEEIQPPVVDTPPAATPAAVPKASSKQRGTKHVATTPAPVNNAGAGSAVRPPTDDDDEKLIQRGSLKP